MKRLGEIALFTADVDRLVRFYSRVLGLEPVGWQPGETATFMLGDVKLFLHRKGEPSPDVPPNEDHIAFVVADVDGDSERLRTSRPAALSPVSPLAFGLSRGIVGGGPLLEGEA